MANSSLANILDVGAQHKYKTIVEAITLAHQGDTLNVYGGIYREGIIEITKPITLFGFNQPIIDGQLKYECVRIKASHVTLKGFIIQNSGVAVLNDPGGIKCINASHICIQNNVLKNNFFGIYLQQCSLSLVKNNRIEANGTNEQEIGNGIHCWKSDSIQVIGNQIKGHRDGIYFEFVTNTVIWRNISTTNVRYGIHFMFSNKDAYISNVFRNNGSGVAVMFSNHVTMVHNTFDDNMGAAAYGILLKEISDSYIYGNCFAKNTVGLYLEGASRMLIQRNLFKANGWGLKIQASCMDNIITENNFIQNTFDCATNGDLVLNTFHANYWDQYDGYDLNHDRIGDIPFHPLSLFSVVIEKNPPAIMFFRSFLVNLLDQSERLMPNLTPENFKDIKPHMNPYPI